MADIKRIIVEKKTGFQVEAERIKNDLVQTLGIQSLVGLRILNVYDVEGLTAEEAEIGKTLVFSEPPVDDVYTEELPIFEDEQAFGFMYLPGQYDQRADSAAQCLETVIGRRIDGIRCSRIWVLSGEELTEADINTIKEYAINPVDSTEISLEKPESVRLIAPPCAPVPELEEFCTMDEAALKQLYNSLSLAMSEEDFIFTREYFKSEHRNPTMTEIKVLDTYWSDHCRHTTFMTVIDDVKMQPGFFTEPVKKAWQNYLNTRDEVYTEGKEKPLCLMDLACIAMKEMRKNGRLPDLDESEEINACTVKIKVDHDGTLEDWLFLFKNETHNHPTEIEPFGGAATCLGGAIRDPLSGRAYVYQAMRVTGAADPRMPVSQTLRGKLPQRKICKEAAHGYSSYGNQIGLATGKVTEIYDDAFVAKRMEVGAVVGAAPAAHVRREAPAEGDIVLLLGGRTGRDGIGGATGSSKEHTEASISESGAEVQKGNPPTERKLQRLFRDGEVTRMIKRCNDFGAGGVAVAVGELTDGLVIDLDAVPLKYSGLDGTEVAVSESQERMAVVISACDEVAFMAKAAQENLECTKIAEVTAAGRLEMNFKGQKVVDLSREFLNSGGVRQHISIEVLPPAPIGPLTELAEYRNRGSLAESMIAMSLDCNIGSQKGLGEMFDSTIGAGSVLMPFGGRNQLTPAEGMAAHLPVEAGKTTTTSLMTCGFDPLIAHWSPFHGGLYAVLDSVTRLVAMGGSYNTARLTLQEYFEKLKKDSARWGKPLSALLGAFTAEQALDIPGIGGKDSMSGSFGDIHVPPCLLSFAVDITTDQAVLSPELKGAEHRLVMLQAKRDENLLPDFVWEKHIYDKVAELNNKSQILSAISLKQGGICEALIHNTLGNAIGVELNDWELADLLKPEYGSILLEVTDDAQIDDDFVTVGKTIEDREIRYRNEVIPLMDLVEAYLTCLNSIYPPFLPGEGEKPLCSTWDKQIHIHSEQSCKPKVLIPVFPGTNCEYDSADAFTLAGAESNIFVVRNQTPDDLKASVKELTAALKESQILMLPGGFSAGDEPEGSAKFITAIFRDPALSEAVAAHLEKKNLILGICNGFQALVKLGLLPYGEIRPLTGEDATLTFNLIGRHISTMARTKLISKLSPWYAEAELNKVYTVPLSHGEGRFVAPMNIIGDMITNGQIATQYVNGQGRATMIAPDNPNGSVMAIEGITDKSGLILGKMGHSERFRKGLYKNIPGEFDMKIFESGVKYFE